MSKKTDGAKPADQILSWIICGLVFLLPLVFLPNGYNRFSALRAGLLMVAATAVLLRVIYRLLTGGIESRKPKFVIPLVVLTSLISISTIFSVHFSTSVFGQFQRYEGWLAWVSYLILLLAAYLTMANKQAIIRFLYALEAPAIPIMILGIAQHFGYDILSWTEKALMNSRSGSLFGNAAYLGAYCVLILPIAASLAFSKETPRALRAISIALVPLTLAALLFTLTRGAWLGTIAAIIVLIVMNISAILKNKRLSLGLAAGAIILTVMLILSPSSERYVQRAVSSFNSQDGTVKGRLLVWRQTALMIKDRPVLGSGPDTFAYILPYYTTPQWEQEVTRDTVLDKAHNDTLQVASTMGIPALLAYFALLAVIIGGIFLRFRNIKDPLKRVVVSGVAASAIGYLVQAQFLFGIVDITPVFWIILGMGAVITDSDSPKSLYKLPLELQNDLAMKILAIAMILILAGAGYLAARPVQADIALRQGVENLQSGDIETGFTRLRSAAELDPFETNYKYIIANWYIKGAEGVQEMADRRLYAGEAIKYAKLALSMNPVNEYSYLYLGNAYLASAGAKNDKQDLVQAAEMYRKVIEIDPNLAQAHLRLGVTYTEQGNLKGAIGEWEKAAYLAPYSSAVFYNLGLAYEQLGNKPMAIKNLERCLKIDPKQQQAADALENINRVNP